MKHFDPPLPPNPNPELLYPLQDGYTPLLVALRGGHTTCAERLLSTPGIDVNIGNGGELVININDN